MKDELQAWEWRDPADVVERRELQQRAATAKEMDKRRKANAEQAERQLLLDRIFRKASRA